MLRRHVAFTLSLVAAGGVLAGCQTPAPQFSQFRRSFEVQPAAPMAPPATNEPPMLSDTDEVMFYDLVEAHGLEVSIDLVTGRRVCKDGDRNTVIVMPSARSLTINGKQHKLTGSIRWRDGALVLPGECRTLLAEHLSAGDLPDVAADPELFDGRELHLGAGGWEPAPAKPAVTRRQAPGKGDATLPTAWRVEAKREWKYIIIHHSATGNGGAESFGREHQKKWPNGLGYHFVVGNGTDTKDGQIEVGPRWRRQGEGIDGAHAGNERYNKHGIGICLVGDFDGGRPTREQLVALRRLCKALMQKYGITRDRIYPHGDVRKGHTDCPGKNFPMASFLASL